MAEPFSYLNVFKVIADFGVLGLVIYLWWADTRLFKQILQQYKQDMDEQRRMYDKNVSLVKDYHSVAGDLKNIVILVTQQMTTVASEIRQNEFCPLIRVKKEKVFMEVPK